MADTGDTAGPPSALTVLQKRIRAARKKLTRIQELEALQASGKELTPEQLPTVRSKPVVVGVLDELQKVDDQLKELIKTELAAAYSKGHAAGYEEAQAVAAEQSEGQLASQLAEQQEQLTANFKAQMAELRQEQQSALQLAQSEWQAQVDAANAGKQDAEAATAAAQAALEQLNQELRAPFSKTHPLKGLLEEQLRKLLHLLYFSQLFDHHRNIWALAHAEVAACIQYEHNRKVEEGEARVTEQDLMNLAYFGRTLVDRMNMPLSHKQCLDAALGSAMQWLLEPQAVAINAPPAPTPITMGDLARKLSRILSSEFCRVVPPDPSSNAPGAPAGAAPSPGFAATATGPAAGAAASGTKPAGHAAAPAAATPAAMPAQLLGTGMDGHGKDAGAYGAPLPPAVHPSSKVLSAARRDNSPVPTHHGAVGSAGPAGLPGQQAPPAPSMVSRVLSSSTTSKSASPTPPLPAAAAAGHTGAGKVQLPAGILDDGTMGDAGMQGLGSAHHHQAAAVPTHAYPHIPPHTDHHAFRVRPGSTTAPGMGLPGATTATSLHAPSNVGPMVMGMFTLSETGAPVPVSDARMAYDMSGMSAAAAPGGPTHLMQPGTQDGLLGFR